MSSGRPTVACFTRYLQGGGVETYECNNKIISVFVSLISTRQYHKVWGEKCDNKINCFIPSFSVLTEQGRRIKAWEEADFSPDYIINWERDNPTWYSRLAPALLDNYFHNKQRGISNCGLFYERLARGCWRGSRKKWKSDDPDGMQAMILWRPVVSF